MPDISYWISKICNTYAQSDAGVRIVLAGQTDICLGTNHLRISVELTNAEQHLLLYHTPCLALGNTGPMGS